MQQANPIDKPKILIAENPLFLQRFRHAVLK